MFHVSNSHFLPSPLLLSVSDFIFSQANKEDAEETHTQHFHFHVYLQLQSLFNLPSRIAKKI